MGKGEMKGIRSVIPWSSTLITFLPDAVYISLQSYFVLRFLGKTVLEKVHQMDWGSFVLQLWSSVGVFAYSFSIAA